MNKKVYVSGLVFLNVILLGAFFKIMHFPGAGISLIVGLGGFALVFYPMAWAALLKSTDDKLLKRVYHAAFISFLVVSVGALFKIMHWPGASIFLYVGLPLPFVLFLPVFVYYHHQRKLKTGNEFFGIFFFMLYMAVFSSVLALGMSRDALESFLNLERSSRVLVQQLSVNSDNEATALVQMLEKVKYETAVWANPENAAVLSDFNQKGYLKQDVDYSRCESLYAKTGGYFFMAHEANNAYTEFINRYERFRKNENGESPALNFVDAYVLPHKGLVVIENLSLAETLSVLTQLQVRLLMLQQTAKLP